MYASPNHKQEIGWMHHQSFRQENILSSIQFVYPYILISASVMGFFGHKLIAQSLVRLSCCIRCQETAKSLSWKIAQCSKLLHAVLITRSATSYLHKRGILAQLLKKIMKTSAGMQITSSDIHKYITYIETDTILFTDHPNIVLTYTCVSINISMLRIVGLVVKASASRAEDPGLESRLRRDLSGFFSYQWLKNYNSIGYPARRLALWGQCWDWSARCQYTVTGWDGKLDLQLLSQCGST